MFFWFLWMMVWKQLVNVSVGFELFLEKFFIIVSVGCRGFVFLRLLKCFLVMIVISVCIFRCSVIGMLFIFSVMVGFRDLLFVIWQRYIFFIFFVFFCILVFFGLIFIFRVLTWLLEWLIFLFGYIFVVTSGQFLSFAIL